MDRLVVVVLLLAAVLASCDGYCKSLGWNPSFNGPPTVEQVHAQKQQPSHALSASSQEMHKSKVRQGCL